MVKSLTQNEIIDFVYKTPQYSKLSKEEGINRIGIDPTKYPLDYIQDFYANKVFSEPTATEMNNLLPALKKADEIALKIMGKFGVSKNIDWKIAKINKGYDWNFPQTRVDVVFLPEWFFEKPSVKTLVHEKLHLYQRQFPEVFNKLYNKWGFKKIQLNDSEIKQIGSLGIYDRTINNPDTTDGGVWVFRKNRNVFLLPVYVINSENGMPTTLGFNMDFSDRRKPLKYIGNISSLSKFFGANQIDHPNEIFACRETKNISF